ncbi:MAG: winged helix-turn-helix transcriptional regulator [Candidatus Woesearchaeota archaeon]
MDKIDDKLLRILIADSRQPISQIAAKARVSRDVAQYRISQLKKSGIIRDFITLIDHEKLGFISALFFVSVRAEKEKEFIGYINSLDFVSWAGTHLGFWSLGMAIYGRNPQEVEERFQLIFQKYKDWIGNHQFAFYKTTEFYTEKYFGQQKVLSPKVKLVEHKTDGQDKIILWSLSKKSRMTCVELAGLLHLTPVAVSRRIAQLEKSGYIKGYSIYINVLKLKLYLFIFFIQNNCLDQRKKLFSYLQLHPRVSLLLDYIGDPFIEFGIFVKDPYEARAVIQEIKEAFPDNRIIDFFLTQEDFISFGAPRCVFK